MTATPEHPPQLPEPDRAAFEEFHGRRKNKGAMWRETLFERSILDGAYVDESVQRHWWTWQNATATLRAELSLVREQLAALTKVSAKVACWLDRLADGDDAQAKAADGRLPAFAEACRLDAKNKRATAKSLHAALQADDAKGEQG